MPESPEIDRIRTAEQDNYRISRDALGATTELADDCLQLYDSLPKLLTTVSSEASDHEFAAHIGALTFYGACRYQLTMSVLAVLRGHATDAMVFLRRAIELCAFGALVKRHPQKALVWLDAGTGGKAYKIYQDKFGTKSLFPGGDSVLTALWKRYDFCSKVMHGSIYSVSRHIKHEGYEDYYNYFDIEGPQDPNLVISFFYTVDSHHEIQSIFSSAFKNELRDRQEEWAVLFTSVKAKADFHREKWKPTIRPMLR